MGSKPKNLSEAIEELGRLADHVKPQLEELQKTAGEEASRAKKKIENEVSKNPWAAVGIAGLIFFILGFLFASRRNRND